MQIAGQGIRVGRLALTAWGGFLVLGLAATASYFALPADDQPLLYDAIGLSSVMAIMIGVARHAPSKRLPWHLFAAGQLCFVVGDVLWNFYYAKAEAEVFPSVADVAYLAGYPLIAAGLVLLVRSRTPGRDVASILDATIISVGVGVLSWTFLIAPYIADPGLSWLEESISVAYPLMDLLLLAVAAHLFSTREGRTPSFRFLVWGIFSLLAADALYGFITLSADFPAGHPIDALWLTSYVAWGVAALHPSMKTAAERTSPTGSRLTPRWVVVLAGASLLAPATLAVQYVRSEPLEIPVTVGGAALLFVLTLARMGGVASELERKKLVQKSLEMAEREREGLAAELHDGPIQGLTVMTLNLELLRLDLADEGDSHSEALKELQERVSQQVVALRRLMAELRPPVLEERGLVQAIVDYAHEFEVRSGVTCSIQSSLEDRLKPWQEVALYRIVQEGLRNVEKHASAQNAKISLSREGDRILMLISDDGAGFDPKVDPQKAGRDHFGLAAMKGRAENLGGHLQVRSRPGSGTVISVSLMKEAAA